MRRRGSGYFVCVGRGRYATRATHPCPSIVYESCSTTSHGVGAFTLEMRIRESKSPARTDRTIRRRPARRRLCRQCRYGVFQLVERVTRSTFIFGLVPEVPDPPVPPAPGVSRCLGLARAGAILQTYAVMLPETARAGFIEDTAFAKLLATLKEPGLRAMVTAYRLGSACQS